MPCLRDKVHDGVLCTFNTKNIRNSRWICQKLAAEQLQCLSGNEGRRHGPSITTQISPCWVTLLQPDRRASVMGHLSSLWRHWQGQCLATLNTSELLTYIVPAYTDSQSPPNTLLRIRIGLYLPLWNYHSKASKLQTSTIHKKITHIQHIKTSLLQ